VLLAIHLSLSAGLYWAMSQPPDAFGAVMKRVPLMFMRVLPFQTMWKQAREGQLRTGDPAPDFRLPTIDHTNFVTLSSLRGTRPVVLVFGSYT